MFYLPKSKSKKAIYILTYACIFTSFLDLICLLLCFRHMGPVWQVAWAHPKFGSVIATCSYDRQVLIWKETSPGNWTLAYAHREHQSSGK